MWVVQSSFSEIGIIELVAVLVIIGGFKYYACKIRTKILFMDLMLQQKGDMINFFLSRSLNKSN